MFTIRRLGIDGTLVCTNLIESMIGLARTTTRNVKRWRDEGDTRRRWCPAGLLEAEKKFRRVPGHAQMLHFVAALRLARRVEAESHPLACLRWWLG